MNRIIGSLIVVIIVVVVIVMIYTGNLRELTKTIFGFDFGLKKQKQGEKDIEELFNEITYALEEMINKNYPEFNELFLIRINLGRIKESYGEEYTIELDEKNIYLKYENNEVIKWTIPDELMHSFEKINEKNVKTRVIEIRNFNENDDRIKAMDNGILLIEFFEEEFEEEIFMVKKGKEAIQDINKR